MEENIFEIVKTHFLDFLASIGPKLIYVLIILIVGIFLIKFLVRLLRRLLKKSKVELSLISFVESFAIFILYGLLFFIIGIVLGIKASSFLAIFGAAGIAIALALQGSLANFAGGVLILVFKPFRVDDIVFISGNLGTIQSINILYTYLRTLDGRIITIPNGLLSNNEVDNRSKDKYRRIEMKFNFSFDEDMDQLREIMLNTMKSHPKVIQHLPQEVYLNEIGEHDMKVIARCWTDSTYFWDLYWIQIEAIKKELYKVGIKFSFPKRAVYYPEDERRKTNR